MTVFAEWASKMQLNELEILIWCYSMYFYLQQKYDSQQDFTELNTIDEIIRHSAGLARLITATPANESVKPGSVDKLSKAIKADKLALLYKNDFGKLANPVDLEEFNLFIR